MTVDASLPFDDETYAGLQKSAREHLWMHFTRMSSYDHADVPIIVKGEGAYIYDAKGRRYLDALAGLFVSQLGHGRTELADAAAKQARELAFMPLWSYAHPNAIQLAERVANYAPGDLNRVFFTSGGGEAVETAWKLAKNYFKLTGKPMKHKVISRAIAYHGTTQGALSITGLPPLKQQFEPLVPSTFRVPNTNYYRAPEGSGADARGVRPLGGRPDRGGHRERGPGHGGRGLPGAGAERRRLLPAAARLLPAGPRDLRRVRRAAGLRRGDLRVRPARPHVRRGAVRLPARHDHLRQGHHVRLRTARRDDRHRPADGAVPEGAESFAHGYTFGGHPVSTAVAIANLDIFEKEKASTGTCWTTRTRSARRWRSSRTCRSSATSAATGTSTASSWSRTRPPRRPSTTTSPRSCCAASCPRRCTTPASTAAPTTAATRWSSSSRR